jgi:WD40 repeat protein
MRLRSLAPALFALILVACATGRPALQPNLILQRTIQDGGSALGVDPASTRVVGGGWDGTVQVWRLTDGRELARWRAHQGTVNGAAFVGNDRILTASYDGSVALWDDSGLRLASRAAGAPVTAFEITPDLRTFVTGHTDGAVRWWRTDGLEPFAQAPVHGGAEVLAVAVQPGAMMAASSDDDGRVAIVTPDGGHRWLDPPPADVHTLAFARQGDALYGAGWFTLFRWASAGARVEVLATDHRGDIQRLAFTPDGRELASISRQTDSSVLMLDPATGRTLREIGKHDLCGEVVTVSPDGRYLVSTSDDATVRVWDRRNPRYGDPPPVTAPPQVGPGAALLPLTGTAR